ncbi:amidohydrolase [Candidatus Syntrophocurvum alkaliphilum]|uniref:Amidohydrolase n=1 Tax=Candidatus Syntrophocurvum alkaliphilum TaxID=2293317 RepID=A0A6I6DBD4_9FIRM|nr:amidohydrolase [Candidatus Syntrophocurvum alkaliphilum]QGT98745.1 amidohydrolase [Candidatus Syntrophocurvum alkaliphilum]
MFAIKGGKVLTLDDTGVVEDAVILIEGDTIKAVGKNIEIPQGYKIIDAYGKYITPGFIDTHTHVGLDEEIYRVEGDDVNEITDPITPQLEALDGINLLDLGFKDALRGGVTRIMSMPGSANIIGGQAVFLKTHASSIKNMIYKNPAGLKAALGENPKRVYGDQKKTPRTRMANASLLKEAFYIAAGYLEKDKIEPKEKFKYNPLIKVLKKEMPLLLHAHRADDIMTALRLKDDFDINLAIQHGTEAHLISDELVKRDVAVFLGPLLVNRAKVEMKEISFKNADMLAERGVKFSFISDHPVTPVEHLRVYAALAVREGLNENIAFQALTTVPVEVLQVEHELGTIRSGKRADLVIHDGHPFDFSTKTVQTFVDGEFLGG